jgi:hypothetical protein
MDMFQRQSSCIFLSYTSCVAELVEDLLDHEQNDISFHIGNSQNQQSYDITPFYTIGYCTLTSLVMMQGGTSGVVKNSCWSAGLLVIRPHFDSYRVN